MADDVRRPSRVEALSAIEKRRNELPSQPSAVEQRAQHELRQTFRRMINPGITRPNSHAQAISSMKVLLTLSENLLREPDNPKFQRFKPTNTLIKHNLVEPAGALEYAIEMGFKPVVENFQPYYVWHKRYLEKLRVGTFMLQEHLEHEMERQERSERTKAEEDAARKLQAEKVKMAFLDDRLSKESRDEMERQARDASHASGSHISHPAVQQHAHMPGAGMTLSGKEVPAEHDVADRDEGSLSEPD